MIFSINFYDKDWPDKQPPPTLEITLLLHNERYDLIHGVLVVFQLYKTIIYDMNTCIYLELLPQPNIYYEGYKSEHDQS